MAKGHGQVSQYFPGHGMAWKVLRKLAAMTITKTGTSSHFRQSPVKDLHVRSEGVVPFA